MRVSIPVILTAVMAAFADARIDGVAAPVNIKIGEGFNVRLLAHNYIQSVSEIAAVVGTAPPNFPSGSLGQVLGSYYLGPGKLFDFDGLISSAKS